MTDVNRQSYFLGLCLSSNCLKQRGVSEASSGTVFQAKNLVDHLESVIFKHWHHRNVLKYVPENRSSPSVVQENGY